ncbi:MAG: sugar phosphate isomerase/epimerase family protein [Planctomycetaceae bacterium]
MRLGISSYTYVWSVGVPGYERPAQPLTAWSLLDKAASLDVGVLQLCDNLPLFDLSTDEIGALAKRADSMNIELEAGMSGIDPEKLREGLSLARRLGSPILRVVLDTDGFQPTPDEVVTTLGRILQEFERQEVVLAIENHDRFASVTLRDILRRADSEYLGICFDTANSIGCLESADRVLDALGPRIVNVHLKDYSLHRPPHHKGYVVEGRPAGGGQLDVPGLLARIKAIGRDPNVILELWPPPQATLRQSIDLEEAWARDSIRFLRKFILE